MPFASWILGMAAQARQQGTEDWIKCLLQLHFSADEQVGKNSMCSLS